MRKLQRPAQPVMLCRALSCCYFSDCLPFVFLFCHLLDGVDIAEVAPGKLWIVAVGGGGGNIERSFFLELLAERILLDFRRSA